MQREGVNENVLIAYVEKNNVQYNLSVEEIILLDDVGVPATVVETMIRKSTVSPELYPVAPQPPTQVAVDTAVIVPSADRTDTSYFYEALSPYGSWENDATYGHVWTPTVARADRGWRPYVHNGSWVDTDAGWYWNSGYSWGWAPFHYGRWVYRDNWSWVPDNTWGSAWVSWRQTDDAFGWAPLPPRSRFDSRIGFSFNDRHVGNDFEFGLSERDYAFVGAESFFSADLRFSLFSHDRSRNAYSRAKVFNNYTYNDNNNRVVNNGFDRDIVHRRTGRTSRPLHIRDHDVRPGSVLHAREVKTDTDLTVYRPMVREGAHATPEQIVQQRQAQRVQRTEIVAASQKQRMEARTDNREVSQQNSADRREAALNQVKKQAEVERQNREQQQQLRQAQAERRQEAVKAKHETLEVQRDQAQKRAVENQAEAQRAQEADQKRDAARRQQDAQLKARQDEAQKRTVENKAEAQQRAQEADQKRDAARQQQDVQQKARQDEAQKRTVENKAEAQQRAQEADQKRDAARQQQDAQQKARQDEAQKRSAENKAEAQQRAQEPDQKRDAAKEKHQETSKERQQEAQEKRSSKQEDKHESQQERREQHNKD